MKRSPLPALRRCLLDGSSWRRPDTAAPEAATIALGPVAAIPVWVPFLAAVVTLELIADVIAKEFSLHGGLWRMALAVGFVVAGNVTWQIMLKTGGVGLARAGLLFAVGVAVGATLIGVFGYGEGLTEKQKLGAVLGVVVLALLG